MSQLDFSYRGRCAHPQHTDCPALEVQGLCVHYPGSGGVAALEGVSLSVDRGSRVALIGPNGAGKSTLLKAAVGLLEPASGQIRVFGHAVGRCVHQVAYLPQRSALDWNFPVTVERLVLAGRYVHRGWLRPPGREDKQKVAEALEQMAITDLARRRIGELSGGQQQRALLARALVHDADLLLLDEPLNAIDKLTRKLIDDLLDQLHEEGRTVLMATHDVGRQHQDFDAVIAFEDGRRIDPESGDAREVEESR